jgi:glycerate kinase
VLGIGGSATTDAGMGMATALGMRFLDGAVNALAGNGAQLAKIRHIDHSGVDARLASIKIDIACDVDNPLLGERGAARIYAPQKGANASQVDQLEQGIANLADLIEHDTGKDIRHLAGGGAGGGMGAGLVAFFNASLKPGAQLVLELLDLESAIEGADLVLTCEGQLDNQTRFGKAPAAVAAMARAHGAPCIAIAGTLDNSAYALTDIGFNAVFSLCPGPVSLEDAIKNANRYLRNTTQQIIRCQQLAANRHHE